MYLTVTQQSSAWQDHLHLPDCPGWQHWSRADWVWGFLGHHDHAQLISEKNFGSGRRRVHLELVLVQEKPIVTFLGFQEFQEELLHFHWLCLHLSP